MTITINARNAGYDSSTFLNQFRASNVARQVGGTWADPNNKFTTSLTVTDRAAPATTNTYDFTGSPHGSQLGAYVNYFNDSFGNSPILLGTFFTGNAATHTITGLTTGGGAAGPGSDGGLGMPRIPPANGGTGDWFALQPVLNTTDHWATWTGAAFDVGQFSLAIAQYQIHNDALLLNLINAQQYNFVGHNSAFNNINDITTRDDTFTGGNLADTIRGFGGNDLLDGGNGADYIDGGNGNDYILGGDGADTLIGGLGNDRQYGGAGEDVLYLSAGADYIDGGVGFNTLALSNPTDMNFNTGTFTGDAFGDTWLSIQAIRGSSGDDTIWAKQTDANIARFYGGGGGDYLGGGLGSDILYGDAGVDRLYGFGGHDLLQGGTGNDVIDGGAGFDRVDFSDHRGSNNLLKINTTGWTIDMANGVATTVTRAAVTTTEIDLFKNVEGVIGSFGNDTIFASGRDASLDGGAGIDTLWLSATHSEKNIITGVTSQVANNDIVDMSSFYGHDTFTYRPGGVLQITSTTSFINAEIVHANVGSDSVVGSSRGETIYGDAGNDTLKGALGADAIIGGSGRDVMTGGLGYVAGDGTRDTFIFNFTTETGATTATCDVITDFTQGVAATADRIYLAGIDANTLAAAVGNQAFSWINTSAFTGVAGQLHYAQSGGNTYVSGDTNGDKIADFMIGLTGIHGLAATDFIL
jgi:Ca2+-binding RTX toxin-like protein